MFTPPPKPTVILVPGAWHTPACYAPLITHLQTHSYHTLALTLPSTQILPPLPSFDEDVRTIRDAVIAERDAGRDVVVVLHSYGGIPGSEAVRGLIKKDGEKSGVVAMVYIAAFALQVGQNLWEAIGGAKPDWWDDCGDRGVLAQNAGQIFYNDLPPVEAVHWVSQLTHMAFGSFKSVQTYVPYADVPCSYLVCEADNAVPVMAQEGMIQAAGKVEDGGFGEVRRCGAGHSPFLSQVELVGVFVREAAGEGAVEV